MSVLDLEAELNASRAETAAAKQERDRALSACKAAWDSIGRFPGSLHDRAMAKIERVIGTTRDYRDYDLERAEAAETALSAANARAEAAELRSKELWEGSFIRKTVREMETTASQAVDRAELSDAKLAKAIVHIEHMAAWIADQYGGYSFEALSEDFPDIKGDR